MKKNKVIRDFGNEWEKFNFSNIDKSEIKNIFQDYFSIFPFDKINKNSVGFDMGGGTGRWTQFLAPRVKEINFIEPSSAMDIAKINLKNFKNINFIKEEVSENILNKNSHDFGYCLGVLHHTNETLKNLKYCTSFLKKDAVFLLYLYYNFDNRNILFKSIWYISNLLRNFVSILPNSIKNILTDIIAVIIYFPLARISLVLSYLGINTSSVPLSYYKNKKLYIMRNDSRDRFGTKLEKRYSKKEIFEMMDQSNLYDIKFSDEPPYWVAVGFKK